MLKTQLNYGSHFEPQSGVWSFNKIVWRGNLLYTQSASLCEIALAVYLLLLRITSFASQRRTSPVRVYH